MPVFQFGSRAATLAFTVLACIACSEGPTDPAGTPGIRIVSGANVADTIGIRLAQPLVIEVRRPNGQLARGAQVVLDTRRVAEVVRVVLCDSTSFGCPKTLVVTDTTDGLGRISVPVFFNNTPGRGVITISAPAFGFVDSATYTIGVGNIDRVRAAATDTALTFGTTATLVGRVTDRVNNVRPEVVTVSASANSAITLNAAISAVTAQDIGTAWVYFRYDNLVDSTRVRSVPPGRLLAMMSEQVRMVNTDGSAVRTIFSTATIGIGGLPKFDPSRQRVSFENGSAGLPSKATIVDSTGASRRDIDLIATATWTLTTRLMADGTLLLVARQIANATYYLYRVGTDNSVTEVIALPGLRSVQGAADISPDGTRIAYTVPAAPTGLLELRVMDVATGAVTVLENPGTSPRWSRQGDKIAFVSSGGLTIINPDRSGRRIIMPGVPFNGIAWSPDASYLAAYFENSLGTGMRIVRVSDGASVPLLFRSATGETEAYYQPDWR